MHMLVVGWEPDTVAAVMGSSRSAGPGLGGAEESEVGSPFRRPACCALRGYRFPVSWPAARAIR